ncbi:MAG TPA: DUF1810 domain-containing protein [Solirubrobacteraceae bacterium]|jgi:uncharacterized protein (DUF1810 family)|nr:DUF1810 domain-containing protein [Solirubrobacteraceae bacterium]
MTGNAFNLQRFVEAQDRHGAYEGALTELRAGRKRGHWIWFVFPQIEGLGSSETARFYGIASLEEASAYLAHPVLGRRLSDAAEAMLGLAVRDPGAILGGIDAIKLRSSMTLFAQVQAAAPVFRRVLDEFYAGTEDAATLQLLRPR